MPILVSEVVTAGKMILDAEGSDRYLFDLDFRPGINAAQDWLISVFNASFSSKKLQEESLRELIRTRIWQTNSFSRIAIDGTIAGDTLWTILGVFPEPVIHPLISPPAIPTATTSVLHADRSFISSDYSAKLLSTEEWNENRDNVFMAGNNILSGEFLSYAYRNFVDYSSTNYAQTREIEIRPALNAKFVGISYLKNPTPVTLITDSIQFPHSVKGLIIEKMLNYMSKKQNNRTSLYLVTEKDVATLVSLMT